jgi:hypothetical protein
MVEMSSVEEPGYLAAVAERPFFVNPSNSQGLTTLSSRIHRRFVKRR